MADNYVNVNVTISEGQKVKIKQALSSGKGVSIRLTHENLKGGKDVLAITASQANKIVEAYNAGKGYTIKMSKTQVEYNMKIEGGFLQILAGLLPSLLTGLATSLAGNVVDKVFNSGSGIYMKKGSGCYKAQMLGEGLYIKPYKSIPLEKMGEGLYLKSRNGFIDGKGLLLGPNSPLKNVPILGWIL